MVLERIAKVLQLDEREVRRRLSYIDLTEEERKLLRKIFRRLRRKDVEKVLEELYEHLLSFEEMREILLRKDLIKKHRKAQEDYFKGLLKGNYDREYVLSRLRVGLIHERASIQTKYLTGALSKLIEGIFLAVRGRLKPEELVPVAFALFKIVIFDLSLILDTYYFSKMLRDESRRYRAILSSVKDAILVVDLETMRIVDVNKKGEELLGKRGEDIIGHKIAWIFPRELRHLLSYVFKDYIEKKKELTETIYIENKASGEWIPVEIIIGSFEFEGRKFGVGVLRDERKKLKREEYIKKLKNLYETLSRINTFITTVRDEEELFKKAVKAIKEGGFRYVGLYERERQEPLVEEGFFAKEDTSICIPLESTNGKEIYLLVSRYSKEGFTREEVELLKEITHDLTFGIKNIIAERRASHLELYDPLTDLPNRNYFTKKLEEYMEKAEGEKKEVGLLLFDIDHFSELNQAFGHTEVDRLLKKVSKKLRDLVRSSDFIGRIGADEFGIIVYSDDARGSVDKLMERVREEFSTPILTDSSTVYITFSCGASFFPEDGKTPELLFKNASASLLRAKSMGGNKIVYYTETEQDEVLEKVKLRSDLRRAIQRKEFVLYYQPKIDLKQRKIVGAEALIRWVRDGKIVPPSKFIPVLEEGELIQEVGEWVIRETCRQVKEWKRKGIDIPVAVNISPVQIKFPSLAERLIYLIAECGRGMPNLEIEITESAIMENITLVVEVLKMLTDAGIKVYIDDFGTGHSSLAYLKKLPAYAIKIDREFIKGIPQDRDDVEIVKATILLAKTFNLKTVAEGVETGEQATLLSELGCDYAQGYYFAKPMPAKMFEKYYIEANEP